ncbi:hypothetical protein HPB51_017648 [Rhipicephalus microplus]|uniref:Transposable element P transposase-like RNase H domain-containing protein n=1 Tax=Rhipicephalus microplus TaxID=6941 RepID=A0A9J6E2Q8_RHIMP|nr:hypothetical protein HPB51_017648 [Rhipicephalus microplus]
MGKDRPRPVQCSKFQSTARARAGPKTRAQPVPRPRSGRVTYCWIGPGPGSGLRAWGLCRALACVRPELGPRHSRDLIPRPAGQQPSTLATRPPWRGKYAADSSAFCEWAVRSCLRKELGSARAMVRVSSVIRSCSRCVELARLRNEHGVTGAQQSIDSSQHSPPASQAIVIFAKSDRVLDLERRLDLEQKRRRKAEREGDRLRELLGRVFSSDQINVLEKGTMRGNSWSPASLQKALHVKVACGSKGCQPTVRPSNPTTNDQLANHALVFMLAGLTSRWEQAVAYQLTSSSFHAGEVKNCLFDVNKHSEAVGITVSAVVTDMGPGNMAIWRLCGMQASKYGKPKVSYPHPCGKGGQLYFLADAPHPLKNLRGHLIRGQEIILHDTTVKKENLPSNKAPPMMVPEIVKRAANLCFFFKALDIATKFV